MNQHWLKEDCFVYNLNNKINIMYTYAFVFSVQFLVQLHSIDYSNWVILMVFSVIYALITSLMGIKSFDFVVYLVKHCSSIHDLSHHYKHDIPDTSG